MPDHDVLIVGGGPVGSVAALMLAEQGMRVALVEQSRQIYPYARAVSLDPFSLETVKRLLGDRIARFPHTAVNRIYYVLNKERLTEPFAMAAIDDPHLSLVNWFEQPILETLLREKIQETPEIDAFYGHACLSLYTTGDKALLRHMNTETGDIQQLEGDYIIGCDGGGSMVRKQAGIGLRSLGDSTLFLIVDCAIDRDKLRALPEDFESGGFQIVDKVRPTTFIIMEAKSYGGMKRRVRFEFRLNPGDDFTWLQSPEGLKSILGYYLDTDAVTVQRSTVYKFNSLVSEHWRKKMIFLCGDACHQTSPFTGQGLNMGIRHAADLVTKLALVHGGQSQPALLDRYQIENYDATVANIKEALFLGKVLFNTTPMANTLRDSIHWFRGSGKNPIDIVQKFLPTPMPLPDALAAGPSLLSSQRYRSRTPPSRAALAALQLIRVRDAAGEESYLMWNAPTRYRMICKQAPPPNLDDFNALHPLMQPLTQVLHPKPTQTASAGDVDLVVSDPKRFARLFSGGVQYVLMGRQYMMMGTYKAGEEGRMLQEFRARFDLAM